MKVLLVLSVIFSLIILYGQIRSYMKACQNSGASHKLRQRRNEDSKKGI